MLIYPFNDSAGLDLAAVYRDAQQADGLSCVPPPCAQPAWPGPQVLEVTW